MAFPVIGISIAFDTIQAVYYKTLFSQFRPKYHRQRAVLPTFLAKFKGFEGINPENFEPKCNLS
jgi:hypothetical protein